MFSMHFMSWIQKEPVIKYTIVRIAVLAILTSPRSLSHDGNALGSLVRTHAAACDAVRRVVDEQWMPALLRFTEIMRNYHADSA